MKALLAYFAKKRLLPVLAITVLLSIISIISVLNTTHVRYYSNHIYINNGMLTLFTAMIGILAVLISIFEFSFKMNKNTIDAYYSLPIKKDKFFLTKFIVGLFEILIPFTIAYFVMVIFVQFKENEYATLYFFLYYIEIVLAGTLFYSIISFIYTKANTIFDGLILLLFYTFLGGILAFNIESIIQATGNKEWIYASNYYIFSQLSTIGGVNNDLLAHYSPFSSYELANFITTNVITTVLGILCFYLLIFKNSKEKAENASDLTESYCGYKSMLPIYIVMLLIAFHDYIFEAILIVAFSIFGYFIYNRSFKLSKGKLISYASSVVVGIILSILIHLIFKY